MQLFTTAALLGSKPHRFKQDFISFHLYLDTQLWWVEIHTLRATLNKAFSGVEGGDLLTRQGYALFELKNNSNNN